MYLFGTDFPLSVFGRRYSRMSLEVFAEGELFGESKTVGNFLDLHIWPHEEVLGLVDGEGVNPPLRGLA